MLTLPSASARRHLRIAPHENIQAMPTENNVSSIELSPTRKYAATTQVNGIVELYNVDEGRQKTHRSDASERWNINEPAWSCAFNPSKSESSSCNNEHFAVGGDGAIFFFKTREYDWTTNKFAFSEESYPAAWNKPIRALKWMSKDVLSIGNESGQLFLYDCRTGGVAERFVLGRGNTMAGVSGIRVANSDQLLAAGVKNWLCKFDVRMSRRPLFRFPEYRNSHYYVHGFDVNNDIGVVAASRGADSTIQTWDMHNGQPIRHFHLPNADGKRGTDREQERITCIRFTTSNGGDAILASEGKALHHLQ